MRTFLAACALAAPAAASVPALAGSPDGSIQIKAFATAVLPDGQVTDVITDRIGLPATAQTRASDSIVPTVAAEYFVSPAFSIETICCVTPHDVAGLGGARLIDDAIILPATVTGKLHLETGVGIKPYAGAGITRFFIFGEDVDGGAAALGTTGVNLSDDWGLVLQGGIDVPLGDNGLGLSIDAKRYFDVDTTATFRAGGTTALQTRHQLDPWVVSAGLAYRV